MARPITTTPLTPQNAAEAIEIARLGDDYTDPVQIVTFSPDSTLLACSTYDKLYLWDVARRALLAEVDMAVQALTFSPDNSVLVAAGRDIVFLEVPTGDEQGKLKGHPRGTTSVAFSPDGTLLASGGMDGVVRIGNLQTRRLAGKFEHPAPVRGVAFSPAGDRVAVISWGTGDEPKEAVVWALESGEKVETFPCTKEKNVAFSPDGARLAVDGRLFDIEDRRVIHNFKERQIVFSTDGQLVAACHSNYPTVGLWDTATGDKLATLKGHGDPVLCVAFNAAGTLVASGSGTLSAGAMLRGEDPEANSDRSVRLWGVPEAPTQEPARERKPLRRLGEVDEADADKDDTLLKPVQDWFNKLSR
ncbi:MAG: hypothetical protein CL610_23795 [Anaerolineaceae bacterium]|nr:hypothetical protein [Anaerolineaceae bacterium]